MNLRCVKPASRRGRRAAAAATPDLATERAQHVAEILASGQGICPKPGIDPSRIRIATAGPGQGADFRRPTCAASIRERRGSKITSSDDLLKDQRVEIWFVPKGATPPPSASNAQPAPDYYPERLPEISGLSSLEPSPPKRFGGLFSCGFTLASELLLLGFVGRVDIALDRVRRKRMLWTIFVILLVLWLLGMVSSYTLGGFIHVLLVIAIAVAVIQLISGRRAV